MNRRSLKNIQIPPDQLLIHEYFTSIQGEGSHTGKPAFFIRFSGCDIGCQWCDSKDAISLRNAKLLSLDEVVSHAIASGLDMIVITGGEPALHDLTELSIQLKNHGKTIHLETSGAYPVKGHFDWMTLSPKKINPPAAENYLAANELKVVVRDSSDIKFGEEQASRVNPDCILYLQPEWESRKDMTPLILAYILKNPRWRLSLQVHKFVHIK